MHLLLALGLGACVFACSRAAQSTAENAKPVVAAENKPAAVSEPVILNGCLQEGTHGAYILTELNEPKNPDTAKGDAIAQERVDAARHAYHLLSVREIDLSRLVGKQVRVEGKQMQAAEPALSSGGTAGPADENEDPTEIRQRDLAKVQVDAIRSLGKSCGGSTDRKTGSKRA
jgi:hypothetical protein